MEKTQRRIREKARTAVARYLTLKPLWRNRKFRIFLIMYFAITIAVSGVGIWKLISEPAQKDFPKTTYEAIVDQLIRGKVKSLGIEYIGNDQGVEQRNTEIILAKIMADMQKDGIFTTEASSFKMLSFAQLMNEVGNGEVKNIIFAQQIQQPSYYYSADSANLSVMIGQFRDNQFFIAFQLSTSLFSEETGIYRVFRERGIEFWGITFRVFDDSNFGAKWGFSIVSLVLWLLLFPTLIIINRFQIKKTDKEIKSDFERSTVRFEDIAGIDEAKEEILKIVDFIRNPDPYLVLGAELPAGILLEGAPGVGKTLLARAIAGECGFPFITSEQAGFVDIFVGAGPKKVRELFAKARAIAEAEKTRVILFIDEIDSVGKRTSGEGSFGANDEQNRTIAQLNQEIDGLHSDCRIIILAATNRPENIDPALLRPGRLSKRIVVPTPSLKGRIDILRVHTKNKPLASSVDLENVAKLTPTGTTGADLMNIVNVAAMEAGTSRKKVIEMKDFEKAIDTVTKGEERKSIILTPREKWIFSVHEAGHTLSAIILRKLRFNVPLPEKVSIIPTTKGLGGYTQFIEDEERFILDKKEYIGLIQVLFGGRVAEQILIGEISSGAQNDYERASAMAEQMAVVLAMEDDRLGQRILTVDAGSGYLGSVARMKTLSSEKLSEVDRAIDERLNNCHQSVKTLLTANAENLRYFAEIIRDHETLKITPEIIDSVQIQLPEEAEQSRLF